MKGEFFTHFMHDINEYIKDLTKSSAAQDVLGGIMALGTIINILRLFNANCRFEGEIFFVLLIRPRAQFTIFRSTQPPAITLKDNCVLYLHLLIDLFAR